MQVQEKYYGKSSSSGKRDEGPAPGPVAALSWGTIELCSPARKSIQELFQATPGSAGLDLSFSTYTALTPEMGVEVLPTGAYGPLPPGTMALLWKSTQCS